MESTNQNRRRQTKGRQKIEIKPIEKKSQQQVTFSKRRDGLNRKASELSILCGAKVAIVGFTPGGKPFSFGHPDVFSSILDGDVGETMVAEGLEQSTQEQHLQPPFSFGHLDVNTVRDGGVGETMVAEGLKQLTQEQHLQPPFSFGHLDVNTVLNGDAGDTMEAEGLEQSTQDQHLLPPVSFDRLDVNTVLDGGVGEKMVVKGLEQSTEDLHLQKMKIEYENSLRKLEEEVKKAAAIEELSKMGEENQKFWWDESIDNMGLEELEEYVKAMQELKKNVFNRVSDLTIMSHEPDFLPLTCFPDQE